MNVVFHGQSCIGITLEDGRSLLIDPFLSGNPLARTSAEEVEADYILLTHAHQDHIQDAAAISKRTGAPIVAIPELAAYMSWQGAKTLGMNMGGTVDLGGFAKATMVQAFHSSGIVIEDEQRIVYGGMPAGFVVEAGGLTFLHAGDTCLFSDMALIGRRYQPDVAFIPIGGHYTMGQEDALQAAEWYGAKLVVPIHYDTFPPIRQDADAFVARLGELGLKGQVVPPGGKLDLAGLK
ncbi:metal-dependent hydrolase [Paenibacillus pasadenensis]|uniref:metal-dependent hydrolase n=1 Tax=Paenibacillus pasadenensis TaxID=217090 RepID=UPI00041D6CFF|nr:metal-dependent hydrolase [Paenibacillus pasadenensis]